MGQEIASLKLNINQLAGITGVHRQTVAARLKNVDPAPGSNAKLKLFSVTDVLTELMIPTVSGDVAEMTPSDRLARLNVELIEPRNADVNAVLVDIERKYRHKAATPETIADMERKAARLIRRLITTKVKFIK